MVDQLTELEEYIDDISACAGSDKHGNVLVVNITLSDGHSKCSSI